MASEFPNEPSGVPPQPTPPTAPAPAGGGMIGRIQRLLLTPAEEWTRIDAEPTSAMQIFLSWAVPLAAIGPVCSAIGLILFLHWPIGPALTMAVLSYLGALAGVWILAFIIDALAPSFGGSKNMNQAMKVAAYSYTPGWVAGVLSIVPGMGIIGALIGLYGFYLLWIGLPKLMKSPADKSVAYVIVSIVVAVIVYAIIGAIIAAVVTSMMIASVSVSPYGRL